MATEWIDRFDGVIPQPDWGGGVNDVDVCRMALIICHIHDATSLFFFSSSLHNFRRHIFGGPISI